MKAREQLKTFPRRIRGNPMKDDIFEQNPFLEIFPEIQRLKDEKKVAASRILWAFLFVEDPRSFFDDVEEDVIKAWLEQGYLDSSYWVGEDWDKYEWLGDFVAEHILRNEAVQTYRYAKKVFDRMVKEKKFTVSQVKAERLELEGLREDAMNVFTEAQEYYINQGVRQPGLLQRTKKERT